MDSLSQSIKQKIVSRPKGEMYFINDFASYNNDVLVTKALSRLEKNEILVRLAKGIYLYPKRNQFGIEYPSLTTIATEIAKRDKVDIMPIGAIVLNQLGLSTQVPTNAVYITTGSARVLNIGNRKIIFKRATPKIAQYKGKVLPLVVLAIKEIGKENITEQLLVQISDILQKEKSPKTFTDDIQLAPQWIKTILLPLLQPYL